MPQRNFVILLVALAAAFACYVRGEQDPYARYVARSFGEIESGALVRVPNEELFNSALEAMVDLLHQRGDEHSQFIPSDDADSYQTEMRQQFGGIGVRIRFLGNPPELTVVGAPNRGSPAARADIRANDRLLKIDGQSTVDMNMTEVLHLMRGQPGEMLKLLIRHTNVDHPEVKELVREVITVDSILGDRRSADGGWEYRLQSDPRIAQVRVTTFGNKTADELEHVLTRLTSEGVEAVVLDLRDDAGGSLDAAVAICDMLLPGRKQIVETRGRDDVLDQQYVSSGRGKFAKLPLAVLVNSGSASASEIVAACLQDNDRAVVFGERSYGKGTVQKLIPVESGHSLLKLTSAKYRRPNGKNIQRMPNANGQEDWGVSPNSGREVPLSDDEVKAYKRYRSVRDLWGEPPQELLADGDTEESDANVVDSVAEADFVDRPLDAAREYLQSILDGKKSA